nr:hypothetical protein BaRGS_009789 [Batillaria attramentaria]
MPLIDSPFKWVAVDLVGPISPPSEDGHRYIQTLVDYATRYPEAVPLKKIDTPTVAEALVDMFSRLGIPEEILSNRGTQFISDCIEEVNRLLSIHRLTTTPYHPMCYGLVEKFNMLKKFYAEQPRSWNRYINALLFAYREQVTDAVEGTMYGYGINDYKVQVNNRVKVYHANLLKKYVEREHRDKPQTASVACLSTEEELDDVKLFDLNELSSSTTMIDFLPALSRLHFGAHRQAPV